MMGVGISSYIVFSNFKRTLFKCDLTWSTTNEGKRFSCIPAPYLKTRVPAMPQLSLGRVEKPTMDRILLIGLLFSAVCACLGKPADSAGPVAGIWWYLVYCAACWLALVHFLICTSGIATTTNACTCTPANVTAAAGAPTEVNCVCPNAAAVATANVTAAAAPVGNWLRCVRKI